MTAPPGTHLEELFQRYGDDLYRLALLLELVPERASEALARAARRLAAAPPASPDEPAVLAALLAALPPERRPGRAPPAWARPPAVRSDQAPILAAIVRLPRLQRLVLGLTTLHDFTPTQIAALLEQGDEERIRELRRDALLALAPLVAPDQPLSRDEHVPEACLPTRAALALKSPALEFDPAIRGHLALCAACRSVEQAWRECADAADAALRDGLRGARLPIGLEARLRAALSPDRPAGLRRLLAKRNGRIAAITLAVLGVIGLLIVPGRRFSGSTAGPVSPGLERALEPQALVEQAQARLYEPPAGPGIWHGRWEVRWDFADGTYAPLVAELWRDPSSARHRLQLVHRAGGGPYEFELADGESNLWYAAVDPYGPALYPLIYNPRRGQVRLRLTPDAQERMLQARLESGAWGLARAYLRQAAQAELRSWGRQRATDGATVEVIGFLGASPLGLPLDAPNAIGGQATILLTIGVEDGMLREVRELIGPPGGEQIGRVVWRFVGGEQISKPDAIAGAFDLRRAWNGVGSFAEQQRIPNPMLPLFGPNLMRLAEPLSTGALVWMPAEAPPGAVSAALLGARVDQPTIVYLGEGRRLIVQTGSSSRFAPPWASGGSGAMRGEETIDLGDRVVTLIPTLAQSYYAQIGPAGAPAAPPLARVYAQGYTRAELLAILPTIGPLTIDAYRAQARLFVEPQA